MINSMYSYRLQYYLRHPYLLCKDTYRNIKHFIQRGNRGYADCDWWSLDSYLCDWLPHALRDMADKGIGYPGTDKDGNEVTPEMWHDILYKMAEGLEANNKIDDIEWETLEELREKNQEFLRIRNEALELFVKYFDNLWD